MSTGGMRVFPSSMTTSSTSSRLARRGQEPFATRRIDQQAGNAQTKQINFVDTTNRHFLSNGSEGADGND